MRFWESYWVKIPWWSVKKISKIIWIASLGLVLIAVIGFFVYMNSLPTLSTWHTTMLKNEYTTKSNVKTFKEYLALEDKLFKELDSQIYDKVRKSEQNRINRYTKDSLSDPKRWTQNWNKSFELPVNDPKAGIVLLHGMSDSPYSLLSQAKYLHKKGVWVVALRMPGHGTVPTGLTNLKWQDMAAVVKLGIEHLKEKIGSNPIHIMGYSTGAAMALNYTLEALETDSALTLPTSLILFSPAIGVSKIAPLAVWQSRIGYIFNLPSLEWNSLSPEFDPFKYGSFAVNAGDQVYRLSNQVQKQFDQYEHYPSKKKFPPVLGFASIVDNTVSIPAVIEKLFKRLPKGDHSLVLFDINHHFSSNNLVKQGVSHHLQTLRDTAIKDNYDFELITNKTSNNGSLQQITNHKLVKSLPYHWPKGLYSLSHLALPISSYDPLYGNEDAPKSPGIHLGHSAIYGETGILQIPAPSILRLRWNPFHTYTKERVLVFLGLGE